MLDDSGVQSRDGRRGEADVDGRTLSREAAGAWLGDGQPQPNPVEWFGAAHGYPGPGFVTRPVEDAAERIVVDGLVLVVVDGHVVVQVEHAFAVAGAHGDEAAHGHGSADEPVAGVVECDGSGQAAPSQRYDDSPAVGELVPPGRG